jgi:hypothetical protein
MLKNESTSGAERAMSRIFEEVADDIRGLGLRWSGSDQEISWDTDDRKERLRLIQERVNCISALGRNDVASTTKGHQAPKCKEKKSTERTRRLCRVHASLWDKQKPFALFDTRLASMSQSEAGRQ